MELVLPFLERTYRPGANNVGHKRDIYRGCSYSGVAPFNKQELTEPRAGRAFPGALLAGGFILCQPAEPQAVSLDGSGYRVRHPRAQAYSRSSHAYEFYAQAYDLNDVSVNATTAVREPGFAVALRRRHAGHGAASLAQAESRLKARPNADFFDRPPVVPLPVI